MTGAAGLGGLIGDNGSNVSNCRSEGDVTGTEDTVGGLVAINRRTLSNCYSMGNVKGAEDIVGGLVGRNDGELAIVSDCYSSGSVEGHSYIGGLIGYQLRSTVSKSSCNGAVTATGDCAGGLVGGNHMAAVSQCFSTGRVEGQSNVGGLAGENGGILLESHSSGDVVARGDYAGGVAGKNEGGVSQCQSTGLVEGQSYVGGLLGYSMSGFRLVSKCFSTGNVTGTGDYVGGFAGYDEGRTSDCYCRGDVVGSANYIGGFAGQKIGPMSNCYSSGDVNGGGDCVGGLVGRNYGLVESCFWNSEMQTHGVIASFGENVGLATDVAGVSTNQMQTMTTFNSVGWDFAGETGDGTEDIWGICEGMNYPRLTWQVSPADIVCPDGVNLADYAFFAVQWHKDGCGVSSECGGADFNQSGSVDVNDLFRFVDDWLAGLE